MISVEPEAAEGVVTEHPPMIPRFEVRAGEMLVLAGPPGSGKSALLAAAAGLRTLPGARVLLRGQALGSISHRRRRAAARAMRLFYLPQEAALVSNLTVFENLLLPIRYLGERAEDEATRESLVLLDAAGLSWAASWLPARLSHEDRKTVALLRGFLRHPEAALLDEPLAGLDEVSLTAVRPLLRSAVAADACAVLGAALDAGPFEEMGARVIRLPGRVQPPSPGHGGA